MPGALAWDQQMTTEMKTPPIPPMNWSTAVFPSQAVVPQLYRTPEGTLKIKPAPYMPQMFVPYVPSTQMPAQMLVPYAPCLQTSQVFAPQTVVAQTFRPFRGVPPRS